MIGFIGGGNMAEAIIKGMTNKGITDISVSEPLNEKRKYLKETYKVNICFDNKMLFSSSDIIILAVKQQNISQLIQEIGDVEIQDKIVVSIAAGISLSYLKSGLKTNKILRVMPNTPAIVHEGMSVISLSEDISDADLNKVKEIFTSIGEVLILPEKYMNAVTALSGSGPGFISYFIDSMIEGGINAGLDPDIARTLAIQTLLGTAKLLNTGINPSALIKMVASPGGTTEAGLKVLENNSIKSIISDTIEMATKRSEELGG